MNGNFKIEDKIVTLEQLLYQSNSTKIKGLKVGFTNGCFDILHKGHVAYLEEA